ncbi:phosphatase 2C-like domain-containing protein [Baffinella frigidus]|nr:phosphatase 2C-like domain-containing protein [Cryptophyta sp. CCMP2293]
MFGRTLRITPADGGSQNEDGPANGFGGEEELKREQWTPQSNAQGPMHVAMLQGDPNYMEDNWAVLLNCGLPSSLNSGESLNSEKSLNPGESVNSGEPLNSGGAADEIVDTTGEEVAEEDRTVRKEEISLFGVFDGHNGKHASAFAREHLLRNIASRIPPKATLNDLRMAVHDGYLATDADFLALGLRDGACLVTALDVRSEDESEEGGGVVGALPDEEVVMQLTEDHKPDREDETRRIEALGGYVMDLGVPRVMGYLAVSRAMGDVDLKQFVVAEPETWVYQRTPDQR